MCVSVFSILSFFFLDGPQVQGSRRSGAHCLTCDLIWLGKPFFASTGSLLSHLHAFCVYICECVCVLFGCSYICTAICNGYSVNLFLTCIGS